MRAAVIIVLPGSRNAISQFGHVSHDKGYCRVCRDLVRCCSGQHVDGYIESRALVFQILPNLSLIFLLPSAVAVLVKMEVLLSTSTF
jgi:hypothetical protein